MKQIPTAFLTTPVVYAVGHDYQIMVPVSCETLMWVQVGNQCYYDDSNGILRSNVTTHRMIVPMEELDRAGAYTICFRRMIERKPYRSETGEIEYYESSFRPIPAEGPIKIYHISDSHNRVDGPVAAARYFGDKPDLLVLNGDIPNHSGEIAFLATIHEIASEITDGERPIVFSRGNHDTRGIYAENIADHTPTRGGISYFSFRLGSLWGLVLDCGEDKPDDHIEYGHTICCEDFRRRETAYIREIIRNAREEYEAEGVRNRLVIVHNPFTETLYPPFDIEQETFSEWSALLREYVKPQLMLCGHMHQIYISEVGSPHDHKGQPCTLVCGSRPEDNRFIGCALVLERTGCRVIFNDHNGETLGDQYVSFPSISME
jgi:predicted phosphodiesterase